MGLPARATASVLARTPQHKSKGRLLSGWKA